MKITGILTLLLCSFLTFPAMAQTQGAGSNSDPVVFNATSGTEDAYPGYVEARIINFDEVQDLVRQLIKVDKTDVVFYNKTLKSYTIHVQAANRSEYDQIFAQLTQIFGAEALRPLDPNARMEQFGNSMPQE